MDKISVIVPVYNIEEYISECIESVINQDYKNLQIILVDDGSTDKSGKICDDYKVIDERIEVIHKKNGGLGSARNAGLARATGDFISFVDGDDILDTTMYSAMIKVQKEKSADIIEILRKPFYNIKELKINNNQETYQILVMTGAEALKNQLSVEKTIYSPLIAVWCRLYKTELVKEEFFPENRIHEDYCWDARVFVKANKYIVLEKILYYYRKRKGSITSGKFKLRDMDMLVTLRERNSFLQENSYNDLLQVSLANYYSNLLIFYNKCCDSFFYEDANEIKNELNNNSVIIKKFDYPLIWKIDFFLFYHFSSLDRLFWNIRELKSKLRKIK